MLAAALLLVLVSAANATDKELSAEGKVFSGAQEAFATTYSKNATTYHYGRVIVCDDALELTLGATVGSGAGATTKTRIFVEWLPINPLRIPPGDNPWQGITYTESGYPANAGNAIPGLWSMREPVMMTTDASLPTTSTYRVLSTTTLASSTLPILSDATMTNYELVAAGNYMGTIQVKAPACRIVVWYSVADVDQSNVTVYAWKRYRHFARTPGGETGYHIGVD